MKYIRMQYSLFYLNNTSIVQMYFLIVQSCDLVIAVIAKARLFFPEQQSS